MDIYGNIATCEIVVPYFLNQMLQIKGSVNLRMAFIPMKSINKLAS